jgi:hypothetical protein
MAFKLNQVVVANTTEDTKPAPASSNNQLSVQELAFLINALKKATLTGDQIEFMYTLILKLQNQLVEQSPK